MKLMTSILLLGLAVTAWAQNPDVIQDTRTTMKLLQQKKALDSDAALRASQGDGPNPAPASGQAKVVPPKPSATGKSVTALPPAPKPSNASQQVPVKANAGKTLAAHKTAPGLKPAGRASTKTSAAKKAQPKQSIAVEDKSKPAPPQKKQAEVINLTGRRDPFISPVVNRSMVGSGCSTGKRCLSIGEVNLKGVVKADTGMIAVVVNTMNKAYFLRENDPVFNGYVVKITGDSIIFKETLQDKLGKPFTRDVTKKITTPAV
jgi:Tfp pilus assembly protein PilP